MAHEWADFVEGQFETPFGPMDYALTQANHVSISAGGSSNKAGPIVVNGVEYYTHIHLFLEPSGIWMIRQYHDLHMTKPGQYGPRADASDAARKKAAAGIAQAWMDVVAANPGMLGEGELRHVQRDLHSLEEEIAEKEKEWADLVAKRGDLLRREAELSR